MNKQRVLVVGAGRRATETIFPALLGLRDQVQLAGVVARSPRKLSLYNGELVVDADDRLDAFDPASLDTIMVAVPRAMVPSVLGTLANMDVGHVSLMLDTPVMDPRHLGATRHFARFKKVVATEDAIGFPSIAHARQLVAAGEIGRLRHVRLFHSGFRNHGLAAIRFVGRLGLPSSLRVERWHSKWFEIRMRFPKGVTGAIVHPESNDAGRLMVVGDRGAIVDYPTNRKDAIEIGYRVEGGSFVGLTVAGEPVPASELDLAFGENVPVGALAERSLHNQFKIRGLMELIARLGDDHSDFQYDPYDAISDHQIVRVAERFGALRSVPLPGGRSAFGAGIRGGAFVSRVLARR